MAQERLTVHTREALCSQETRLLGIDEQAFRRDSRLRQSGRCDPFPTVGDRRLVRRMSPARADHGIEDVWPRRVYAWLCTSATVEGLVRSGTCWAAGQIGEAVHPVNGCPQDPGTEHLAADTVVRNESAK